MIVFFLYSATIVLCALSLQASFFIVEKTVSAKIVQVFFVLLFIHSIHIIVLDYFVMAVPYVNKVTPYDLLYGPMLYFAYAAIDDKKISKKQVVFHLLPFIGASFIFVFVVLSYQFQLHFKVRYCIILYSAIGLSWLMYGLRILACFRNLEDKYENKKWMCYSVILVLVTSLFILLFILNTMLKNQEEDMSKLAEIIAFIRFFAGLLVYRYILKQLSNPNYSAVEKHLDSVEPLDDQVIIARSDTEERVLTQKIMTYLHQKQYLDVEFNIEKMAYDTEISKTVIQQVLKLHFNDTFSKVINALRIKEACIVLADKDFNSSVDQLALQCGFNSRAAFYRNFNRVIGCTPIEFHNMKIDEK